MKYRRFGKTRMRPWLGNVKIKIADKDCCDHSGA
jgi:hypothetical protein